MGSADSLVELLAQVAGEADTGNSLHRIVRAALEMTRSRHAMVAVLNEEIGELEIRAECWQDELGDQDRSQPDVARHEGIVELVATTGSPVLAGNANEDQPYKVLFPIPSTQIQTNPLLQQNPGY